MKKLLALGLVLLGLLVSNSAFAAWNADWTKRVKITLDTSATGVSLPAPADNVTLLVRLHTGNFQFIDAKPDGTDLRFIASDDKTPLKFHIEKYDGVNELALVWVQVPRVNPGTNSDFIWLYYGNDKATAGADVKGSFDPAQALVYHFGEKETVPQDSTANANNATSSTAKPGTAGLIGGDEVFDGHGQIQVAPSASLRGGPAGATVSMWIKPADASDATLYAQAAGLKLAIQGGHLVAQAGGLSTTPGGTITGGAWQHVAVVAKDGLVVYLNGAEVGRAAGATPSLDGAVTVGDGFKGDLDELEVSSTARTPAWIRVAALSQGPDGKLVSVGQAEGGSDSGGPSYLHILLNAVTPDGWVVIALLMVMFVISIGVMVTKARSVMQVSRENDKFKSQFEQIFNVLHTDGSDDGAEPKAIAVFRHSPLYHLYAVGSHELQSRFEAYRQNGLANSDLTAASINAIRSTIDARLVRETQRLNSRMVLLTIAIAGGPFLGLLGTVVGVMITFAAIAAAGDVNVNSIAPGIAAALVATVAGLAVAIPALFGYNYLSSRISELTSDMQVFVDEFITRIAEKYST